MADLIETPQAWRRFSRQLPGLLWQLLESDVYNDAHRPPGNQRGVYLFSTNEAHLYVGRTSVTARARAAGNLEGRSFRGRYSEHTTDGRPPGTAAFAARVARERAGADGYEALPSNDAWWQQRKLPVDERDPDANALLGHFAGAKAEIRVMRFRILPLEDDERGVRSTLFELYVHAHLGTRYNDFSTS